MTAADYRRPRAGQRHPRPRHRPAGPGRRRCRGGPRGRACRGRRGGARPARRRPGPASSWWRPDRRIAPGPGRSRRASRRPGSTTPSSAGPLRRPPTRPALAVTVDAAAAAALLLLAHAGWTGPVTLAEVAHPSATEPADRPDRRTGDGRPRPATPRSAWARRSRGSGATSPPGGTASACSSRGRSAPGAGRTHRSPRTTAHAAVDEALLAGLRDAGSAARDRLAAVDPGLAADLAVTAWAPWQVALGAVPLGATVRSAVHHVAGAVRHHLRRRVVAPVVSALVVAVVGPTATGKSDLGLALAEALGGEVVNADAMQLYRGMDIGTAKLTARAAARRPAPPARRARRRRGRVRRAVPDATRAPTWPRSRSAAGGPSSSAGPGCTCGRCWTGSSSRAPTPRSARGLEDRAERHGTRHLHDELAAARPGRRDRHRSGEHPADRARAGGHRDHRTPVHRQPARAGVRGARRPDRAGLRPGGPGRARRGPGRPDVGAGPGRRGARGSRARGMGRHRGARGRVRRGARARARGDATRPGRATPSRRTPGDSRASR